MNIAELNVARALYPLDDSRMAGFTNALDTINAIADRSPGFVWRLQSDSGNATDIKYTDDPQIIANMSVWKSADTLEQFVWQTAHKRIYNQKHSWFEVPFQPIFVMWPVEVGHVPTLAEAHERLEHLRANGCSEFAYGWDGLPHLKLWINQRCA